jgi:hypothetical protein
VRATFPSKPESGRLTVESEHGVSNPVEMTVVWTVARQEAPRVTATNKTEFPIRLEFRSPGIGLLRELLVASGDSVSIQIPAGPYTVRALPQDRLTLAEVSEAKTFERGYRYSLTYEARTFPTGQLSVVNQTGGTIQFTLSGPLEKTVDLPAGTPSMLRIPFGRYRITIKTPCGTANESVDITPRKTLTLTYQCRTVAR